MCGKIVACSRDLIIAGDIRLCQQEHVGILHLRRDHLGESGVIDLVRHAGGIDQNQRQARPQIGIDPREIHDPSGVGHAACLDQDVVNPVPPGHQRHHRIDQPAGK